MYAWPPDWRKRTKLNCERGTCTYACRHLSSRGIVATWFSTSSAYKVHLYLHACMYVHTRNVDHVFARHMSAGGGGDSSRTNAAVRCNITPNPWGENKSRQILSIWNVNNPKTETKSHVSNIACIVRPDEVDGLGCTLELAGGRQREHMRTSSWITASIYDIKTQIWDLISEIHVVRPVTVCMSPKSACK